MLLDQGEGAADAGQHAERKDVDFQDAERVEIVLVPFDQGAVLHRRILDRHQLRQGSAGDHETADMLRQVARKTDHLAGEVERLAQGAVRGVEPGFAHPPVGDPFARPAPHHAGERGDNVARKAHRLADLADRAAGAVADDRRGEPGAVAAVFLVDVLDNLLAPLMLEIDVDVGRLAPRGADEALEQHIDAGGIDRGDAEAVADDRIGRRAAPLAQDAAAPGKRDDVVHGQKIAGVLEPLDQCELMGDEVADALGDAGWINTVRPSRRLLRSLLRMTTVFYAIQNLVILRSARRARLEGRAIGDAAAGKPLRMTTVFYAIQNLVILRSARRARLEGRAIGDAAPGKPLRMTTVFYAIQNLVILRSARRARLEGRAIGDAAPGKPLRMTTVFYAIQNLVILRSARRARLEGRAIGDAAPGKPLRMTTVFYAIQNLVILRSARRARLEGRA